MSTLHLRLDDRSGLGSTENWSNSALGHWGNHHQQVLNVLEPASMSPSSFYTSHTASLQSQSMFPQLMQSAAQDSALVRAFTQAKVDFQNAHNNINSLEYTLLQSSNSNSMVESSTSDEDCTAPEIHMNCISALGGGPVSPVVANVLDRFGNTGAPLMAQGEFLRMQYSAQTSPGGGPLSPGGVSVDSLHGADGRSTVMAGLKRPFEAGDEEQMSDRKMQIRQHCEKAQAVFQDSYGGYAGALSSSALGVSSVTSYNSSDPGLVMPSARTAPFMQKSNAGGGSVSGADMDSIRAILFRHASQPVPSLEEIASSRPKRRNVRISKDPQSVAARHRRERISDRMRVLQRLVPGGTKMDTASMLDEAIHYVKFLKLQLQTLEQIGNNSSNCDAQGSFAQPQGVGEAQLGSLARRPFDLNCGAAFQARPLNNNSSNNNSTSLQAPPQGRHSNQWA